MSIQIYGLDPLLRSLGSVADIPQLLSEIAEYIMATIKVRTTEQGLDADENPFADYTPSYKAFRQENGQPVDHVYLVWTGGMMNAMTYDVQSEGEDGNLTVFFRPTAANPIRVKGTAPAPEPAPEPEGKGKGKKRKKEPKVLTEAAKAYFLSKKRPFFALSERQVEYLTTLIDQHIARKLEENASGGE